MLCFVWIITLFWWIHLMPFIEINLTTFPTKACGKAFAPHLFFQFLLFSFSRNHLSQQNLIIHCIHSYRILNIANMIPLVIVFIIIGWQARKLISYEKAKQILNTFLLSTIWQKMRFSLCCHQTEPFYMNDLLHKEFEIANWYGIAINRYKLIQIDVKNERNDLFFFFCKWFKMVDIKKRYLFVFLRPRISAFLSDLSLFPLATVRYFFFDQKTLFSRFRWFHERQTQWTKQIQRHLVQLRILCLSKSIIFFRFQISHEFPIGNRR